MYKTIFNKRNSLKFNRFIGSTTYEEFNRYMAQSKGIVRRFQQIDIKEPTEEEAIKILEGTRMHSGQVWRLPSTIVMRW